MERKRKGEKEERKREEKAVAKRKVCTENQSVIWAPFHLHPSKRMEYSHSHSGMDLFTAIVSRENTPIDLPIGHLLEAFP